MKTATDRLAPPPSKPLPKYTPETPIRQLVHAGNVGDKEAVAEIRRRHAGDKDALARYAVSSYPSELIAAQILSSIPGANTLHIESASWMKTLEESREKLLGDNPSELERLAVELVVMTFADTVRAMARTGLDAGPVTGSQRQNAATHATRRFTMAARMLDTIRRRDVPSVLQVLANNAQVNMNK